MIYLIGGPPKCGKTTLAKQFSKSVGIPWVSTDTLQNVIKTYTTNHNFTTSFPLSSVSYETNDERYAKNTSSEIINAYQQQAKTVYAAVKAFVQSELTDENDYIIEGYHIAPELIGNLTSDFPCLIIGIVLIKKNADEFIDSIHKSTTPNDWILTKTKDETTFPKIAAMVVDYAAQLEVESKKYSIKVICTDGDFAMQLTVAEKYLESKGIDLL